MYQYLDAMPVFEELAYEVSAEMPGSAGDDRKHVRDFITGLKSGQESGTFINRYDNIYTEAVLPHRRHLKNK